MMQRSTLEAGRRRLTGLCASQPGTTSSGLRRKMTLVAVLAITLVHVDTRDVQAQTDSPDTTAVGYDVVRPILRKRCGACHGQDRARGGLDLSSLDGIKAGSSSGPVTIAGNADESMIYTLAAHLETPKMPPNAPKIPQRELDLIRRWIEGGLVERGAASPNPATLEIAAPAQPTPTRMPDESVASRVVGTPISSAAGVPIDPLPRATAITALAVSPKTPLVAVSGRKQIVLFQWTDGAPLGALPFPEGDVFTLRFSRDGELLLAGGGVGGLSGKVVGFEVASGKRLFELGDEIDVVLTADISPDHSLVALGGPGRSVKVFRTADGELTATLRKHTDWILALAFSPDGLLLASGDRFGGLQVWEARSGKEFQTLRGHVGSINAVGWSPDSERLWSAGQDSSLRIWDMHQGSVLAKWDGGVGGILCVEHDTQGRFVCGGRSRKIAVWDNPEVKARQVALADEVVELAVSHDATHAIAGDAAGNITVVSLANGELTGRIALPLAPAIASAKTAIARIAPVEPPPAAAGNSQLREEAAAAEGVARRAASELAEARDAQTAAESAVLSTEESLKKQRAVVATLKAIVSNRDIAAKQAAERAAALRARAESSDAPTEGRPTDLRAEQEQLQRQLREKRSLLESTQTVAERIEKLAEESPNGTSLQSAAKLADQLRSSLARDVETTADELRVVEVRLQKAATTASATAGK